MESDLDKKSWYDIMIIKVDKSISNKYINKYIFKSIEYFTFQTKRLCFQCLLNYSILRLYGEAVRRGALRFKVKYCIIKIWRSSSALRQTRVKLLLIVMSRAAAAILTRV